MKESFCASRWCEAVMEFISVQPSGTTGSENQQVKTHLEISVCKSYNKQIEHEEVEEFSGKPLDISLVFLEGKMFSSGIWTLAYS